MGELRGHTRRYWDPEGDEIFRSPVADSASTDTNQPDERSGLTTYEPVPKRRRRNLWPFQGRDALRRFPISPEYGWNQRPETATLTPQGRGVGHSLPGRPPLNPRNTGLIRLSNRHRRIDLKSNSRLRDDLVATKRAALLRRVLIRR